MPRGIPGPHPGTPNKKRKHEEDLSENPYTRKSRARTARLTGHDRTMDNARNADRQAVNRRLRKLKVSGEYLAADDAVRKRMLGDAVKREIEYRDSIGRSATAIAEKIGYRDSSSTAQNQQISKDKPVEKNPDDMVPVVLTCKQCAGSAKDLVSKCAPTGAKVDGKTDGKTDDKTDGKTDGKADGEPKPSRCADTTKKPDQPAPTTKKVECVQTKLEQPNEDTQQPWSWDSWSMFWKTAVTPIFSKAKRLSRVGGVGAE